MSGLHIITEKCVGCGLCVRACPFGELSLVGKKAVVGETCTLCGGCVDSCRFGAIELIRQEQGAAGGEGHRGIWVFAQQIGGEIAPVTLELLTRARQLAKELQTTVSAVLLGSGVRSLCGTLWEYGAQKVYLEEDPLLSELNEGIYADVITELVRRHRPEILLIGATVHGRAIAPRVASTLNTGLTADCTELTVDPATRLLHQTRPAFGGGLMATILCPNRRPQMATVRPGVFAACPGEAGKAELQEERLSLAPGKTRLLSLALKGGEGLDIAAAKVIVAAGRGIGKQANLSLTEELAGLLGGAPGVSRSLVDMGWADRSRQVGQSGKTVAPRLYIACGISGAIQHMVGIGSATVIVAINSNPDAPIMRAADLAIVGDAAQVLRAVIQACRDRGAEGFSDAMREAAGHGRA